jgi:Uma2 family endonuclease
MATLLPTPSPRRQKGDLPPLENGDHLDQPTFHARYAAMPESTRAELIGGIVYMPSPTGARHARPHLKVSFWAGLYESATPGLVGVDNATVILTNDGEVQPDVCLLLAPEHGGRTRDQDGYIHGAPELVVEVASSSESYDLHTKKTLYEAAGVREYVVLLVRESRVRWYVLADGGFHELAPDEDGLYRSTQFPGLWLDPDALIRGDSRGVRAALERGLASPEHGEFVARVGGGR